MAVTVTRRMVINCDGFAKLGVNVYCTVHTLQYVHKFTCYIVTIIADYGTVGHFTSCSSSWSAEGLRSSSSAAVARRPPRRTG